LNILMLGHSGVGKTTFMASMYGVLQEPVNGFGLHAKHSEDHQRLLKLFKDISRGRYPAGSNKRENYEFWLQYSGDNFFAFNWTDYRGDALTESTRTSKHAQQLQDDLRSTDGVLAFFDCTQLESRRGTFPEIRRMLMLLNSAMQEMDHPVPLALVLAKADLVPEPDDELFDPLENLMETIRSSKHVIGTVIPVACGIENLNVEVPVLFVLHIGIRLEINHLIDQIKEMAAERDRTYARVSTLWDWASDWVGSKLNGASTWGEIAERKHRALLAQYEDLVSLEGPSDSLGSYLEEIVKLRTF